MIIKYYERDETMKSRKLNCERVILLALIVLLEAALIFVLWYWFRGLLYWVRGILHVLSILIVVMLLQYSRHLSSTLMYILGILAFPVAGTLLFLIISVDFFTNKNLKSIYKSAHASEKYFERNDDVLQEMSEKAPHLSGQFRYIANSAGFPFYRNTGFQYYGFGEEGFPQMLADLKTAEKFIFMEYFIIQEGKMWNGILEILEEKAKQGVDVRLIFDDMGSIMTLPHNFLEVIRGKGIKVVSFNRINPLLSVMMNHRDHRKITVIDGRIAYSGGVNLADEYINDYVKYGRWKDNIIRITGESVWSYTVTFLSVWNAFYKDDDDFTRFKAPASEVIPGPQDGYIGPYSDTPLSTEMTGQDIYINMLNQAERYCYIMTPYLIIDTDMENALILAAKRGVDVRIMTPGIPDKKMIFQITRSFYEELINGGVKIYEYTPGFVHAKIFVSDDRVATVGTINLDYRSLYLHFENGTYLFDSAGVQAVLDDFNTTLNDCHPMTKEESKFSILHGFVVSVLRLIAPML